MEKLEFPIQLSVDNAAWEKEWQKKEKEIQAIIDRSEFTIKIGGQGLKDVLAQLKDIQSIQKKINKPLSAFQSAKLELYQQHAADMHLYTLQKINVEKGKMAKEAARELTAKENARAATARAMTAEEKLLNVKLKNIGATNQQTSAYRNQAGVLGGLRQLVGSYLSVFGVYRLISNIKEITSEFELQRVSLRAITQDGAFAAQLYEKIKNTAIRSPFTTKNLVTFTKQLAAYRIANKDLYDTMNKLADVAAGLGIPMERLILAYGQIRAASVLRGQELRQLTEAGIPAIDLLAEQFSKLRGEVVTTGEVFDLIFTRKVPFEMINKMFNDMTKSGGRFYKMQEKQAETLYGVFENLRDNIQIAFEEIGQSNRGLMMSVGKAATFIARRLHTILDALSPILIGFGAYRIALAICSGNSIKMSLSTKLLNMAMQHLSISEKEAAVTTEFRKKLLERMIAVNDRYAISLLKASEANNVFSATALRFKAMWIKSPEAIAIAGLTTLISVFTIARKKYLANLASSEKANERWMKKFSAIEEPLKKVENKFNKLRDILQEQEYLLKSQSKKYEEFKKIYPDLADKFKTEEDRRNAIANATERQIEVLQELNRIMPGYFNNLDKQSNLLEQVDERTKQYTRSQLENQLLQAKVSRAKIEEQLKLKKSQLELMYTTLLSRTTGSYSTAGMDVQTLRAEIKGLNEELSNADSTIKQIQNDLKISDAITTSFRKNYRKYIDKTITDNELAKLNELDAIKKIIEKYQKAKDNLKEYESLLNRTNEQLKNFSKPVVSSMDKIDDKTKTVTNAFQEQINKFKEFINSARGYTQEQDGLLIKEKSIVDTEQKELLMDKRHWEDRIADEKEFIKGAEFMSKLYGFILTTAKSVKDERINTYKEEFELIQKIYNKYEDLRKNMSDVSAKKDIENIYKGMAIDIDFLSPDALKKKLKDLLVKVEKEGKEGKDLSVSIKLAIRDLDLNELKSNLAKEMDLIAREIQRIQESTEYYEQLLKLTGDVNLSQKLTVTLTGIDIKNIKDLRSLFLKELSKRLEYVKSGGIEIDFDISLKGLQENKKTLQNVRELIDKLYKAGNEEQAKQLEVSLKNYSDYVKKYILESNKLVSNAENRNLKRAQIERKGEVEIKMLQDYLSILAGSLDKDEYKVQYERVQETIKAIIGGTKYELSKLDDDYIRFFTHINTFTYTEGVKMKSIIINNLSTAFQEGALTTKEYMKAMKDLETQFNKLEEVSSSFMIYSRGGIEALIKSYEDLGNEISSIGASLIKGAKLDTSTEKYINKFLEKAKPKLGDTKIFSVKQLLGIEDDPKKVGEVLVKWAHEFLTYVANKIEGKDALTEALKNMQDVLTGAQGVIDLLNESIGEGNKIAEGFSNILKVAIHATNAVDAFVNGDWGRGITEVANSVISIFQAKHLAEVRDYDKEIKKLGKDLKHLEIQYKNVERRMLDMVGSDWVRGQKELINNLYHQINDINRQIENEKKKGKSSSEEDIEEYESQVRNLMDEIEDKRREITEKMVGTDKSSAAYEFAQEWLNAYLTFSDTVDAIKQKTKDMVRDFAKNLVLSKIVKKFLDPLIKGLTDIEMRDNLSMQDYIDQMLDEYKKFITIIPEMDAQLRAVSSELGKFLGDTESHELTGIAKSVSQATEEEILTLSGYANSILYNQIYIKKDVAAIRGILEKKMATMAADTLSEHNDIVNVGQLTALQRQSVLYLQEIKNNTALSLDKLEDIAYKLDSVISIPGTSARKTINTRLCN